MGSPLQARELWGPGAGTFPSPSLGVLAPALSLRLDMPAQLQRPPPPREPKLSPASGDPAPPPPPSVCLGRLTGRTLPTPPLPALGKEDSSLVLLRIYKECIEVRSDSGSRPGLGKLNGLF